MGKRTSPKRLSAVPSSACKSVDSKARKRIEELYELTDEIINAYNEINEKYIYQIYRKYKQLQEINKKLKVQLNQHHCDGCRCPTGAGKVGGAATHDDNTTEDDEDEDESDDEDDEEEDVRPKAKKTRASTSPTVAAVVTRGKKQNPFIITDIEDTQNFDANDSRFTRNGDNNDENDENSMDTTENPQKTSSKKTDESRDGSEAEGDENDAGEDEGMARLPVALQEVIRRKVDRNKKGKSYLLRIPQYPALCQYLCDKSHTSFDHRPSEAQVRPLIAICLSPHLLNDAKSRMRIRDELREVHRSYMRTFMKDPRQMGAKASAERGKLLATKKSPA